MVTVAHTGVAKGDGGVRAEVDALTVGRAVHLVFGARGIDQPHPHDGVPVFNVGATAKRELKAIR